MAEKIHIMRSVFTDAAMPICRTCALPILHLESIAWQYTAGLTPIRPPDTAQSPVRKLRGH
jgi:hypothetical protein